MCCLLKKQRAREPFLNNVQGFIELAKRTMGTSFKKYLDLYVLDQLLQDCEQLIISNRQV